MSEIILIEGGNYRGKIVAGKVGARSSMRQIV